MSWLTRRFFIQKIKEEDTLTKQKEIKRGILADLILLLIGVALIITITYSIFGFIFLAIGISDIIVNIFNLKKVNKEPIRLKPTPKDSSI